MRRHKRKIGKMRGSRTVGRGNPKHGRGKGSKRGNKRTFGANFNYAKKYQPWRFSQPGFHSLVKRQKGINLRDLEKLTKEETIDVTKFGYTKVLGSGGLRSARKVVAHSFTKGAKEKIEKAGGKAVISGAEQ